MAVTREGAALTQAFRNDQLRLRAVTLSELRRLWPLFDPNMLGSFNDFARAAAPVIQNRHGQAAQLGAQYFTEFRMVEGVPGTSRPVMATSLDRVRIAENLRSTGYFRTLRATGAGMGVRSALNAGFVGASGSAGRMVMNGAAETVMRSGQRDGRVLAYQRVTGPNPCAFCRMIASRGPVYSADTVDFDVHDHCACTPEAVYRGSRMPEASVRFEQEWIEAQLQFGDKVSGTKNDALNAYRRYLGV